MKPELIQIFLKQLLEEQRKLREQLESGRESGKIVELDQSRVGRLSRMDAMQGQQMALEAARRNEQRLRQIAHALKRIDAQEYGYCVECDEAMNVKRLQFDPAATRCIDCAA